VRDVSAADVQTWVDNNWREDITVREWWFRLAAAGYSYPRWPHGLGGLDATAAQETVVRKVLAENGVIAPPVGHVGATLAGPTILEHGTSEQKQTFVGQISRGETAWCQLFSEPSSGSDLASISTTATPDGDGWLVSGQKVWSSAADSADFGLLLARTDADQPKHRGMTYFIIDMSQPGVEVRPLRQMNGTATFCEVFLDRARVHPGGLLGGLNDGWRVAQTTLAAERRSVAGGFLAGAIVLRSGRHGDLDATVGKALTYARRRASRDKRVITSGAVPWRVMSDLARHHGAHCHPVARQELARYYSQIRVNGWLMRRIAVSGAQLTGADGSLAKLSTSRICQQSRDLSYRVIGPAGLLLGEESPLAGELQQANLASPGTRIGGGTDEIQLNVIGERGLGLPREPATDLQVPYRQLQVGTQRPRRP
jgi:alkylation response protein AidB-like acyl-CoA dehydrogenase